MGLVGATCLLQMRCTACELVFRRRTNSPARPHAKQACCLCHTPYEKTLLKCPLSLINGSDKPASGQNRHNTREYQYMH